MNFSHSTIPAVVQVARSMRATVTLWTEGKDGRPSGVSEFLLYEPDERRFLERARNLFKMAASPFMPLCAQLVACGGAREIDATLVEPQTVAERLWREYRALCCPEC